MGLLRRAFESLTQAEQTKEDVEFVGRLLNNEESQHDTDPQDPWNKLQELKPRFLELRGPGGYESLEESGIMSDMLKAARQILKSRKRN